MPLPTNHRGIIFIVTGPPCDNWLDLFDHADDRQAALSWYSKLFVSRGSVFTPNHRHLTGAGILYQCDKTYTRPHCQAGMFHLRIDKIIKLKHPIKVTCRAMSRPLDITNDSFHPEDRLPLIRLSQAARLRGYKDCISFKLIHGKAV